MARGSTRKYEEHPQETLHHHSGSTSCYRCGKTWDYGEDHPPSCDGDPTGGVGPLIYTEDEPMSRSEKLFWWLLFGWGVYGIGYTIKVIFF